MTLQPEAGDMARIRSQHPGQWTDEDFVECSPLARLLALALRNEADDFGVFEWKPVQIKMRCLPADNVDVRALLAELEEHRQIRRYEVDGKSFGAIRNFCKFQRPDKKSRLYPREPWTAAYCAEPGSFIPSVGGRGRTVDERLPIGGQPDGDDPHPGRADSPSEAGPDGIAIADQSTTARRPLADRSSKNSPSEPEPERESPHTPLRGDPIVSDDDDREDEGDQPDRGFARFWSVYPRRIGMRAAQRAFAKALDDGAPLAELLDGLADACRRWQRDETAEKFIPAPAKWLDDGRWKPSGLSQRPVGTSATTAAPTEPVEIQKLKAGCLIMSKPGLPAQIINRLGGEHRVVAAVRAIDRHGDMTGTAVVDRLLGILRTQDELAERGVLA